MSTDAPFGSVTQADGTLMTAKTIVERTLDAQSFLKEFVYTFGHQSDSYLATAPGRELFWSTDHGGLISYMRVGRHVLVSGGLIAPLSERPRLLMQFLKFVESRRWRATFFCIPEVDLPLFRKAGYRINKLGEEAIIDLENVTFAGKNCEWVRRQSNYCKRHGVWIEELRPFDFTQIEWAGILSELGEVCRAGMQEKAQCSELSFFDGTLSEHELGYRRLFVARTQNNGNGRIEGYVVCNPMIGGRFWATEIYRRRHDAVRGVVPFLIHQIVLQLKREGVEQLMLCIIPGRNCEQVLPGDKALIRHSLAFFRDHLSMLFNLKGIDHFKSRFRPEYKNSYLCSPSKPSVGAIVATVRAFGLIRVKPLKMLQLIWMALWKPLPREKLGD